MTSIFRIALLGAIALALPAADAPKFEYKVLAATKTSTVEKEMNEAASAGYSFAQVMGGESAMGGKEVIVVMAKTGLASGGTKRYKLLATSKTSTLQRELQQAGDEGFQYRGQTVFESAFGGKEVSVILERDPADGDRRVEYKLLATTKTSTMQNELQEAGQAGFELLGLLLGKTAFGGKEVISLLQRAR